MENKLDTNEIEESLRICEELFQNNPDFNRRAPRPVEALELAKNVTAPVVDPKPAVEPVPVPKPVSEEKTEPVKPVVFQAPEPVKPPETPTIEKEPEPPVKPVSVTKPVPEEKKETQLNDSEPDSKKEKSKPNIKKNLIAFGICVVIAIVIALIITNFVASHTKVEGNSMESTLENGDDIIVEKFSYLTNNPERYDIIVFRESESVNYIKRVIALPGETIQITEGKIYINERAIFDAYGNAKMEDGGIAKKPIKLGQDEYFVLGDNRNASKDSRDKAVGVIKRDQIIGKAWLRVLPFDNFGKLE
ncbi:MAG: signal peptidase I [Roseburia sp.]|nr:signal peptidase I [Roseburia sp.]